MSVERSYVHLENFNLNVRVHQFWQVDFKLSYSKFITELNKPCSKLSSISHQEHRGSGAQNVRGCQIFFMRK